MRQVKDIGDTWFINIFEIFARDSKGWIKSHESQQYTFEYGDRTSWSRTETET